jgi:hypothetical protein
VHRLELFGDRFNPGEEVFVGGEASRSASRISSARPAMN